MEEEETRLGVLPLTDLIQGTERDGADEKVLSVATFREQEQMGSILEGRGSCDRREYVSSRGRKVRDVVDKQKLS